jgi:hypothetical protein
MTFREIIRDRSSFLREAASSNPALKFTPSGRWDARSARPFATRYSTYIGMVAQ